MKILIPVFCLLVCSLHLQSQYLNPTCKWQEVSGDLWSRWFSFSAYEITGDTLLDGKRYFTVLQTSDLLQLTLTAEADTAFYWPDMQRLRFIREEGTRFYQWEATFGDSLIIDFNLEPGQMVGVPPDQEQIIEIDTLILNDQPRKVFITENNRKIYEGIGTSAGVFAGLSPSFGEAFSILHCFSLNGDQLEIAPWYAFPEEVDVPPCDQLPTANRAPDMEVSFRLYPNPANERLILSLPESFEKIGVSVLSIDGQRIRSYNFHRRINPVELDLSGLPSGFYVLSVGYENGVVVEKFVKK